MESTARCIKCGTKWKAFSSENCLKVRHYLLDLCEPCTRKLLKRMKFVPKHFKKFLEPLPTPNNK